MGDFCAGLEDAAERERRDYQLAESSSASDSGGA